LESSKVVMLFFAHPELTSTLKHYNLLTILKWLIIINIIHPRWPDNKVARLLKIL
jgi:hypothetical protein